jgi:hypothetical protein
MIVLMTTSATVQVENKEIHREELHLLIWTTQFHYLVLQQMEQYCLRRQVKAGPEASPARASW